MWIGSLVELYIRLHSCLYFSPLEKLFWKTGSTHPRRLAICWASQAFFLLQSRQLLDTWWIDRVSILEIDSLLLDTCSIPQLSTTAFSTPPSIASSTPPDTSAVELYWRSYLNLHWNPSLISSNCLNLSVPVHLPNTLSFTPNLFLKVSSSFFKFFYTW